jgi:pimeloyl-ACP methyl ester carboxylesterase
MRFLKSVLASAALVQALLLSINPVAAQQGNRGSDGDSHSAVRAWFADRYRFAGVEDRVSATELDALAGLWIEATDPAAEREPRQRKLRQLLDQMVRVQGIPSWRYSSAALDGMAARVEEIRGLAVPPVPVPQTVAGEAGGRIEARGRGPVPLVLVGDADYDASVYHEFMDAHIDDFTMYAISLPGSGGTPAPPLPERGPYSATPWLDHAEGLILELIRERNLDRPVVVGVGASVPLVARLALRHPERLRATVLLHGLVFQPRASPSNPTTRITSAELTEWLDATLPGLFPAAPQDAVRQSYLALAGGAAQDSARARELTLKAALTHPGVFAHYSNEAGTLDLRPRIAGLRVPTLVIPSIHDPSSPLAGSETTVGQWLEIALDHPDIPLTVVPFRATRNYAPVDSPLELGRAISDFLAGRPVNGKTHDPSRASFFVSPRSSTTQVLGATEVSVEYHAPAVQGREIWGGLVPYDLVWRAGANAATRISLSRDVLVEGRTLTAGEYSVFLIPRETAPWTLIFNRVSIQFGSFFHRPEHDALRVEVEPEVAGHQEHLRYRILPIQPVEGRFEVHWGNRKVGVHLVAAEGTGFGKIPAVPPDRFRSMPWTRIATDTTGDGVVAGATDATALSFSHDAVSDTVWFRIDLANTPNPSAIGVNLAIDTDHDQGTGSAWWGGSTGFTFDRVATVWVMRSSATFWGTIGIADHTEALAGNYTSLGAENLALSMDVEGRVLYIGVSASDLDDDGTMRLLAAVGSNTFWNDNLPDREGVVLDLRRLR